MSWRARVARWPWPELCAGAAALGGWLLVTWAVASFTRAWQVWPASLGVLLLSVFGWRLAYRIAKDGLYHLTREERR